MEIRENSVQLVGFYGGDETHALSAWTSTSRMLTKEKKKRIQELLSKLAKDGHHTPFEKSFLHFLVTSDIASHIHIIKHRIGVSVNTESARYKELKEDKCYCPEDWDEELKKEYLEHMEQTYKKYHKTIDILVQKGYSRKRAKETARYYLPYGNQLIQDVSFNFRSFMLFQKLRNAEDAQKETKKIADKMLCLVRETKKFELSLKAFGF